MEVKVVRIEYVPSEQVSVDSRNWKEIRKLFKKDFYVLKRDQGKTILRKKSLIIVEIEDEGIKKMNFRENLMKFYGPLRGRFLFKNFFNDMNTDKVFVKKDSQGCYIVCNR